MGTGVGEPNPRSGHRPAPGSGETIMQKLLDDVIETHPNGWDHLSWLELVAELEAHGFDVADPDAVGVELEKRRLVWELERHRIRGLGPKRIQAIADRFGSLWKLRSADVDTLAEIRTIPAALAEKVVSTLR